MLIFPAIDMYEGKAVRLYKGDYASMTVYSADMLGVAEAFKAAGARQIHIYYKLMPGGSTFVENDCRP